MTHPLEVALDQASIPSTALLAVLRELALSTDGFAQLSLDVDWPFASLAVIAPAAVDARRILADRLRARGIPAGVVAGVFDRPSRAYLVEIGTARAPADVPITLHALGDGDAIADLARLGRGDDPRLEGAATSLFGGRVGALALDDTHTLALGCDTNSSDVAHALLAIARLVDAPVDDAAFLAAHARLAGDGCSAAVVSGRDGVSGVRARYAPATWTDLFTGLGLFRGARWNDEASAITNRIGGVAGALDAAHPIGLELPLSRSGLGARVVIDAATVVSPT